MRLQGTRANPDWLQLAGLLPLLPPPPPLLLLPLLLLHSVARATGVHTHSFKLASLHALTRRW